MKSRLAHSLETLESRIAPAAVLSVSSRLILSIHTDADGANLTIVQGGDGKIDVLDVSNANHSLMPTGGPQKVNGIVYIGGPGPDITDTKLQNGQVNNYGYIVRPSLPSGFIVIDAGGNSNHTIEAVEDFATIGGPFGFTFGGTDPNSSNSIQLTKVLRQGDLVVRGLGGQENLSIGESSITGTLSLTSVEQLSISLGNVFGNIFANNSHVSGDCQFTVETELVNGRFIYVGGAANDNISLVTKVRGAITMLVGNGINQLHLQGQAGSSVTYLGGNTGSDNVEIYGSVLGSITAHMGHGQNAIDIQGSMAGGSVVLSGGSGDDNFRAWITNGGALHVALGASQDFLETRGSFSALYLDGGRDLAIHNGMEDTVGRLVFRRNFV